MVPTGPPSGTTSHKHPHRSAPRSGVRSRADTIGVMRVIVVGAGVMGAWTARWLRRGGHHVTLVDRFGPGNGLASSGDVSRITRSSHGADRHYPVWQRRSLEAWRDPRAGGGRPAVRGVRCRLAGGRGADLRGRLAGRARGPAHPGRALVARRAGGPGPRPRRDGRAVGPVRARGWRPARPPGRHRHDRGLRGRGRRGRRGPRAAARDPRPPGRSSGSSSRTARRSRPTRSPSPAGRGCRTCSRRRWAT